jgi:two-component sensor histidine kinase
MHRQLHKQLILGVALWLIQASTSYAQVDSLKQELSRATTNQQQARLTQKIAESFFLSARYDSLPKYGALLQQLAESLNDKTLLWLARSYQAQAYARTDSTRFFAETFSILKTCEENNLVKGIAINCLGLGSRFLTYGKYDQAVEYLLKGYNAIPENADSLMGIKSDLIRTVSAVYHHQGKYTDALDYGLESSRLAESSAEPIQLLKSYLNLSGLYGELASPENALGSANDRARYRIEAKKYMILTYRYSKKHASKLSQGATAFNLGSLYMESNQPDSAQLYISEAIRLGKETSFHELLSNAYRTQSKLLKNPDSILLWLDFATKEAVLAKNPINKVGTSLDKVKVLYEQKKFVLAEKLAIESLQDAIDLSLLNDQRSAYHLLYQISEGQQNFKEALKYYTRYVSIKDSMVNEKNFAKIEELKTRYETELKDTEIKNLEQRTLLQTLELKQKNFLVAGVIVASLVIAGFLWLFFRQRSLRQQQQLLQIENRFLRFQLDPHFISNALVSIQQYMLENNNTQAASYLAKFSRLMRQLLEYSRQELITLEDEIDLLRNYLDIQKLRLKDRFTYEIKIDPSLPLSESKVQPMFAQPFVENAIEHGVTNLQGGRIEIVFRAEGDQLKLEISDNGAGINSKPNASPRSLSTKIIQERIALINKSNPRTISLHVGSAPSGNGTRVQLTLPIYS